MRDRATPGWMNGFPGVAGAGATRRIGWQERPGSPRAPCRTTAAKAVGRRGSRRIVAIPVSG
ncbi:hypothetical protein Asi02nite_19800 [Asanoa siamensis]|uniref:Uncharacterized protein n=1 Tax=Asanoa siamensis TaxID=926357 RepID=A0ABQ4CMF4_9ACTN|nr:hypothetical protein Asi02nite_19800 [Asanoa siamensis]